MPGRRRCDAARRRSPSTVRPSWRPRAADGGPLGRRPDHPALRLRRSRPKSVRRARAERRRRVHELGNPAERFSRAAGSEHRDSPVYVAGQRAGPARRRVQPLRGREQSRPRLRRRRPPAPSRDAASARDDLRRRGCDRRRRRAPGICGGRPGPRRARRLCVVAGRRARNRAVPRDADLLSRAESSAK
jgi:hypothetical protein